MAISDSNKLDYLFKKLFGVAKTDTTANKAHTNEAIASPLLIRGDRLWRQADQIPSTIPSTSSAIVEVYDANNIFMLENDATATANRTWLTGEIDWIPPEFGSTYQVNVYLADENDSDNATSGTRLFASGTGSNDEWFFDYQAGVLNFIGDNLPSGSFANKKIYIQGARYVGELGVGSGFDSDQIVTIINENVVETSLGPAFDRIDSDHALFQEKISALQADRDSESEAVQALRTELQAKLDSDHALFQQKIANFQGIGDSDLTVAAQLRNEVNSLRADLDSDTNALQQLGTYQGELKSAIDSDYALFQQKIEDFVGMTDSDLKVVADLRNDVQVLRADRDSDFAHFSHKLTQSGGTNDSDVNALQTQIDNLKSDRDSDTIVIQELRIDLDAITVRVAHLESLILTNQTSTEAVATDSDELNQIRFTTDSDSTLDSALKFTWRIKTGDNSTLVSQTLAVAAGSTDENVLRVLQYALQTHPLGSKYWAVLKMKDLGENDPRIEYSFKDEFRFYYLDITITSSDNSDNPRFTFTNAS